ERWLQDRLGCLQLSLSCPFRLLHTFLSLRPARHYPRLWIRRSSSERRRDFNPPDLGAAQRTLWLLGPRASAVDGRPNPQNMLIPKSGITADAIAIRRFAPSRPSARFNSPR